MLNDALASQVEELVRGAIATGFDADDQLCWEEFHQPLLQLFSNMVVAAGQQDPGSPGKVRIDMGIAKPFGGLKGNNDTILVIDFPLDEDNLESRFFARYDLAAELVRYAAQGEEGFDIARQIEQLENTILQLRAEAHSRDWVVPILPSQPSD